ALGVLHRGPRAVGAGEGGPDVGDAHAVGGGEKRQPQRLAALEGDAAAGAPREGPVGGEAGAGGGGGRHPAIARVAGITDAVAVVVTLVAVGNGGAVVLGIQHAVVVDVLVAGITDAVVVGVLLVRVGDGGAVVAGVVHAVTVGVHHALDARDAERV